MLILLGLLILLGVQFQWLRSGLFLEKQRLANRYQTSLRQIATRLEDSPLTLELLGSLGAGDRTLTQTDRDCLQDSLLTWASGRRLDQQREMALALQRTENGLPFWQSGGFELQATEWTYHIRLTSNKILARCHCSVLLAIQPIHPIRQMLRELRLELSIGAFAIILILGGAGLLLSGFRRLRRLDRAKGHFIDHLTHELQTPLFSNQLFLKLSQEALNRKDLPAAQGHLRQARIQNQRLKAVTERILELSRLGHAKLPLRQDQIDIKELLWQLRSEVDRRAQTESVPIQWEITSSPAIGSGDAYHLRHALLNLIDNAFKYQTEAAEIQIYLQKKEAFWEISVADRGPGIPTQQQRAIFRKYNRLQPHNRSGYGLGLHYVHTVMQAMGGSVGLSDRPGGGSIFYLLVPIISANKRATQQPVATQS